MVLHKNKWDRKATRAHERKLRAKVEAVGGGGSVRVAGTGAGASQKVRGPVVVKEGEREGEGEGEDKGESEGEDEGESEGGSADGKGEDEDEGRNNEPRGKYSKRKIVDNSWRYEEPEEDPYLKAQNAEEEGEEDPEPDYARMTANKVQLRSSSDEEGSDDEAGSGGGGSGEGHPPRRTLDDILIRDQQASTNTSAKGKSKKIHIDQQAFKDIEGRIAKQNAAEAFRRRFAPTSAKPLAPASADDDNDVQDIDEFLGGLKLKLGDARAPPTGRAMETARVPTAQTHGKGSVLDVEDDDGWLDEMLASGGGARVVAKGR